MTDDITVAFETPEVRAKATQTSDPLDRISVRDYTKEVEIGAFQAERGTMQRIRFNVVLEVGGSEGAQTDDVDLILSYDMITEAIEEHLANERLNLLETLAERIAESILEHPLAQRIFVRIEKLDRIPGTLGVEIVRSKADDAVQVDDAGVRVNPLIVFLSNEILHGDQLAEWLDAVAAHDLPALICVEPAVEQSPVTDVSLVNRRLGLLSIEQNAWVLAAKDERCFVVGTRTELDWAMKNGQLSVWAPSKIVLDAVDKPNVGPSQPLALAQWFAKAFAADHISVLKGFEDVQSSERLQVVKTPSEL